MADEIPPILRHMIKESQRPRSQKVDDAAGRYLLGRAPLKEYLDALCEDKSR